MGKIKGRPERPLSAKSRPSSKEFICSVRPSLNDRFRLEADVQLNGISWSRPAAVGQKRAFDLNEKEGLKFIILAESSTCRIEYGKRICTHQCEEEILISCIWIAIRIAVDGNTIFSKKVQPVVA